MFYSHPEAISWCSDIFIASFCGRIPELSGTAHRSVYYRMPDLQPQPGSTSLPALVPHGDLNPALLAQLLSAPAQTSPSVPCEQWARLWCLELVCAGAATGAEPGSLGRVPLVALNPAVRPGGVSRSLLLLGGAAIKFRILCPVSRRKYPYDLEKCKWKVTESAAIDTEAEALLPTASLGLQEGECPLQVRCSAQANVALQSW